MQAFNLNTSLFKSYVVEPFNILKDPEFEFQRIFYPDGLCKILYDIYRANLLDYWIAKDIAQNYLMHKLSDENSVLVRYFVYLFSYRFSNFCLLPYFYYGGLQYVSKFKDLRSLDKKTKTGIKKYFQVSKTIYKPAKDNLYCTQRDILIFLILIEVEKIHLSQIKNYMVSCTKQSSKEYIDFLNNTDPTRGGLLNPQYGSVEKLKQIVKEII